MTNKFILFFPLMFVVGTAAFSQDDLGESSSARVGIEEIQVATGTWALGDPPYYPASRQDFDIWLTPDQVGRAKSAFLEFVAIGTQSSFVEVNGRPYLLPLNNASTGYLVALENTSMAIPVGLLKPGHNSISFVAGPILGQIGNEYDDFRFRDVLLVLSYK